MKKNQINQLFQSVKELIERSQNQIIRNINSTMVITYFQIGRMIVEEGQYGKERANYAAETLKKLSQFLTKGFGKGYSVSNLEYMRSFYLSYQNRIPQSVIGEFANDPKSQSAIGILETNFN